MDSLGKVINTFIKGWFKMTDSQEIYKIIRELAAREGMTLDQTCIKAGLNTRSVANMIKRDSLRINIANKLLAVYNFKLSVTVR